MGLCLIKTPMYFLSIRPKSYDSVFIIFFNFLLPLPFLCLVIVPAAVKMHCLRRLVHAPIPKFANTIILKYFCEDGHQSLTTCAYASALFNITSTPVPLINSLSCKPVDQFQISRTCPITTYQKPSREIT